MKQPIDRVPDGGMSLTVFWPRIRLFERFGDMQNSAAKLYDRGSSPVVDPEAFIQMFNMCNYNINQKL